MPNKLQKTNQARKQISQAERECEKALEEVRIAAEREQKTRIQAAEAEAKIHAGKSAEQAYAQAESLRRLAQSRIERASDLIVERIVNG